MALRLLLLLPALSGARRDVVEGGEGRGEGKGTLSLSRLLKKALRVAPAGAVRGVDLAAQKKCDLILDRTLDISGGDEKVDPNVTIWPIGEV